MKLLIYNREKCISSATSAGQRSIRMDRSGCIFLSGALVPELGLQEGSMIVLVGDEDDPKQWFLCIVDDKDGFRIRLKRRERSNSKGEKEDCCYGAVFNCRYLSNKILDIVGAEKSVTFMITPTPIEMEGLKLYKILTSNPITRPDRKYIKKENRTETEA